MLMSNKSPAAVVLFPSVVVVLLSLPITTSGTLLIQNTHDLLSTLCEPINDTVLVLNSSAVYNITTDVSRSCVINVTSGIESLTIVGEPQSQMAEIQCHLSNATGFAFANISVTIANVIFNGCGTYLTSFTPNILHTVNSSRLVFKESNGAVLVFINCININITRVNITHYYGFAIITVNSINTTLNTAVIQHSKQSVITGSGGIFLFTKDNKHNNDSFVQIENSRFYRNYAIFTSFTDDASVIGTIPSYFSKIDSTNSGHVPIIHAASLTFIYYRSLVWPTVIINKSYFSQSIGTYAGGLMIIGLSDVRGIGTYNDMQLTAVKNTVFESWKSLQLAVYISVDKTSRHHYIGFYFNNVTCSNSTSLLYATCLLVEAKGRDNKLQVTVNLTSVVAHRNNLWLDPLSNFSPIFAMNNINRVIITGTDDNPSIFGNNIGSAIQTYGSHVYLQGSVEFYNNTAMYGAALDMKNSYLHFTTSANFSFSHCTALKKGGAISIENHNSDTDKFPDCGLQFSNEANNITFAYNVAGLSGNSIFADPIYSCYNTDGDYNRCLINTMDYYTDKITIIPKDKGNENKEITSKLSNIHLCNEQLISVSYPGGTAEVQVTTTDQSGNSVYSTIKALVYDSSIGQHVSELQNIYIKESGCTSLYIQVESYTRHPLRTAIFSFGEDSSVKYVEKKLVMNMNHQGCPPGFQLDQEQHSCVTSSGMKKFYRQEQYSDQGKCSVSNLTITVPPLLHVIWIGELLIGENKSGGITARCPLEFCKPCISCSNMKLVTLNTSEQKHPYYARIDSSGNDTQLRSICHPHRTGVLCSDCEDGYSDVFGSGECMKCSNWWLLTLIGYIIAGPLLIYLLFILRLTLTSGTINGIIFFAQAAKLGVLDFMKAYPVSAYFNRFLIVFLSLLNLNLGFPLCFYNGMGNFARTMLSFMFPVYLLMITMGLIIASRYSIRLSNRISHLSVQVLITVVHLSFSQFIMSSIGILSYVTIITDSGDSIYVWYQNGTITTDSWTNPELVIARLTSVLALCVFVLPYLALLIGGRWILRTKWGNKYLRSPYEAIHGPYKENREYWFTARIILLIIMIVLHIILRVNTISIIKLLNITMPIMLCFLVIQVYLKPFKNKLINIFDAAIMLILILIYVVILYLFYLKQWDSTYIVESYIIAVFILIIFLMFSVVILYHVIMRIDKCRTIPLRLHTTIEHKMMTSFNKSQSTDRFSAAVGHLSEEQRSNELSLTAEYHNHFREPLLESCT